MPEEKWRTRGVELKKKKCEQRKKISAGFEREYPLI